MRPSMLALFGLAGLLARDPARVSNVPSCKVGQKRPEEQLSRQKIQKMKGKKNRKNRGRNRKPQDTALYVGLRR